jgi:hypothetical protein
LQAVGADHVARDQIRKHQQFAADDQKKELKDQQ